MTEADLADECRVLRDGWEVKEGGKEVVDDAAGVGGKRASPILPWGWRLGRGGGDIGCRWREDGGVSGVCIGKKDGGGSEGR